MSRLGRGVVGVAITSIVGCAIIGRHTAFLESPAPVDAATAPLVLRPQAVPQRPQIAPTGNHNHGAVSEDGRIAVTRVFDTVYVWDVERHKQVRIERMDPVVDDEFAIALSPDGETLAIFEGHVRLCRLRDRTCARHAEAHRFVGPSGFTPSGRHVWGCFSDREDYETIVFDAANLSRSRHFPSCAKAVFDDASGGLTVYTAYVKSVRAYHWQPDGVETEESITDALELNIDRAAVSADGTLLALGGPWGGVLINLARQNALRALTSESVEGVSFDGRTPLLVESHETDYLPDGTFVSRGSALHPRPVHTELVAYDEHGARKVHEQGDVLAIRGTTLLTDDLHVITAERTTALEAPALAPAVSVASSRSTLAIAVGARVWRWSLFDPRGATEIDLGRAPGTTNAEVRFIADDAVVVAGEDTRTISLADDRVRVLPDSAGAVASVVAVSPDRARIFHATGSTAEIGIVWRRPFATAVHLAIPHYPSTAPHEKVVSAAFSPSGALLITGSENGAVRVWDASTGAALARLELTTQPQALAVDERGLAVTGDWSASDDDSRLEHGWLNVSLVRRWSFAPGRVPRVDGVLGTNLHAVSSSGARMLAGHDIVDVTGAKQWRVPALDIAAAGFSDDGERLAVTDERSDELRVFEATRELDVVRLGGAKPQQLAFQRPDLVRGLSADGVVHFWRVCSDPARCDRSASGEILQIIAAGTDWIAVDRSGRYDTSSFDALDGLAWVLPDHRLEALPADLFIRDYYVPGLVSKVLVGDPLPPAADLATIDRRVPRVSIAKIDPVPGHARRAKVTLDVDAGGGEAYDLRLFRDGSLAAEQPGLVHSGPHAIAFDIPLSQTTTQVELTAYAFNRQRLKGPTTRRKHDYEPGTGPRPRAVIVGIGIGPSGDGLSTLDYAPLDAIVMSRVLATQLRGHYDVAQVSLVSASRHWVSIGGCMAPHHVLAPTTSSIAAVLARLAGHPHEAPAMIDMPLPCDVPSFDLAHLEPLRPDDVLILYISAHGIATGGELAVVTEGGPRFVASQLATALSAIASDHIVVILDTCASESVVDAGAFRPAPLADVTFGQLAYDKSMQILSASGANEDAVDSPTVGGSLLVHALRERLGHGPVPMGALLRGVARDVPDVFRDLHLAGQVQKPVVFDYRRGRHEVVLGAP